MQLASSMSLGIITCWLEAMTVPRRYAEGLQKMAEMLNCRHASLSIWSRSGTWGQCYQATHMHDSWKLTMDEHAFPAADLQRQVRMIQAGTWKRYIQSQPQRANASSKASSMYADSLYYIRLIDSQNVDALLCLQKQSNATQSEQDFLRQAGDVIGALRSSLDAMIRMRNLSQQLLQIAAVQDCIRIPVLLLDSAMRIQVSNAAARAMLNKAGLDALPGLSLPHIAGVAAERIAPLVRRACGKSGAIGASALQIHELGNQPDKHIVILPIKVQTGSSRYLHQALLLIDMQSASQASADQLLQHIYGLTPAEARLAILILHGESPASAAVRLQVSLPTVRSQLSAVLKKTGALRQADLVRRLSALLLVN